MFSLARAFISILWQPSRILRIPRDWYFRVSTRFVTGGTHTS